MDGHVRMNVAVLEVISAPSVNSFKNRLDEFWADQGVVYDYKANITGPKGIRLTSSLALRKVLGVTMHCIRSGL